MLLEDGNGFLYALDRVHASRADDRLLLGGNELNLQRDYHTRRHNHTQLDYHTQLDPRLNMHHHCAVRCGQLMRAAECDKRIFCVSNEVLGAELSVGWCSHTRRL